MSTKRARRLQLPAQHDGRVLRLIDDGGQPLAALVHDPAVLDQQDRIDDIAAAARLAIANARLQAEVRARVAEVEASRRRLVEAADEQRRQLERELREGAERRLTAVAKHLGAGGPAFAELEAGLEAARTELRELAHGIHPGTLTSQGLLPALDELCARSPVPVEIIAPTAILAQSNRDGGVLRLLRGARKRGQIRPSDPRPDTNHEQCPSPSNRDPRRRDRRRRPRTRIGPPRISRSRRHARRLTHDRERSRPRHWAHGRVAARERLTPAHPRACNCPNIDPGWSTPQADSRALEACERSRVPERAGD